MLNVVDWLYVLIMLASTGTAVFLALNGLNS
jgi:hypothetical protein